VSFVLPLPQMLCVAPRNINTTSSFSSHTKAYFFKNLCFHTNISRTFLTRCCNNSKSLIGSEYTKVCRCHHSRNSGGLRSGDRAGQATRPLRPIHRRSKGRFKCCLATRGRLKMLFYSEPINDLEMLQQRV